MAMNRKDYIEQGRINAIKMRAAVGSVPMFANSGSWQGKAYAEGWEIGAQEVRKGEHDQIMEDRTEAAMNGGKRRNESPQFGLSYNPKALFSEDTPLSLERVAVFPGREVCADRARVLRRRGYTVRFSHKHARTGKAVYVWDMVKKN